MKRSFVLHGFPAGIPYKRLRPELRCPGLFPAIAKGDGELVFGSMKIQPEKVSDGLA